MKTSGAGRGLVGATSGTAVDGGWRLFSVALQDSARGYVGLGVRASGVGTARLLVSREN